MRGLGDGYVRKKSCHFKRVYRIQIKSILPVNAVSIEMFYMIVIFDHELGGKIYKQKKW